MLAFYKEHAASQRKKKENIFLKTAEYDEQTLAKFSSIFRVSLVLLLRFFCTPLDNVRRLIIHASTSHKGIYIIHLILPRRQSKHTTGSTIVYQRRKSLARLSPLLLFLLLKLVYNFSSTGRRERTKNVVHLQWRVLVM